MNNLKYNVLVTGGAGYIGSHTILEIIENTDWKVLSIDNYLNSSSETFDRIEQICDRRIQNHNIDLCDKSALRNFFKSNQIQGVIHFAALKSVPESVEEPLKYYENNIKGMLNLIELCIDHNVQHFIFSSSCSVYGKIDALPVSEKSKLATAESPYARTKQIGESLINDVCLSSNMQFISLRYFNPVGAHKSGKIGEFPIGVPNNLVPYITQTAAGLRKELTIFGNDYDTKDGTCIRDYIHVSDIAAAHIQALQRLIKDENENEHEIFNLGTGNGMSVLEMVKSFEKINDVELNYNFGKRRKGDLEKIYANNNLALEKLNWKPIRSMAEIMKSAWIWQKEISN